MLILSYITHHIAIKHYISTHAGIYQLRRWSALLWLRALSLPVVLFCGQGVNAFWLPPHSGKCEIKASARNHDLGPNPYPPRSMLGELETWSARGVQNKSLRLQSWLDSFIFNIELKGEGEEGPSSPLWFRRLLFRTYRNEVAIKIL